MNLTNEQIAAKVIEITGEQMGVDQTQITRDTNFVDDLNADSLDTVELVMEFEDEFEIAIPDEEAEKCLTVGQAIDGIIKLLIEEERRKNPPPKPVKKVTFDKIDIHVNGDVTQGWLDPSVTHHIAVGCKVFHAIWHQDEGRLEIVERPDLLIYGSKDAKALFDKARVELAKPY